MADGNCLLYTKMGLLGPSARLGWNRGGREGAVTAITTNRQVTETAFVDACYRQDMLLDLQLLLLF